MKILLLSIASILFLIFLVFFINDLIKHKSGIKETKVSKIKGFIIGFFCMGLLDTVGIGSFATTTACFNGTKYVKQTRFYPGTLNISSISSTFMQVLIFLNFIKVDLKLVLCVLICASFGGYTGTIVVQKIKGRFVRLYIGIALLIVAIIILLEQLNIFNALNEKATLMYLPPKRFILFMVCSFIFAVIGSLGIGAYSLYIILTAMIGLNPIMAWPIMSIATSCRTSIAGVSFIKNNLYKREQSLYLGIGGAVGVSVGMIFLIKYKQYISKIIWVALLVIMYTGFDMLYSAIKKIKSNKRTSIK